MKLLLLITVLLLAVTASAQRIRGVVHVIPISSPEHPTMETSETIADVTFDFPNPNCDPQDELNRDTLWCQKTVLRIKESEWKHFPAWKFRDGAIVYGVWRKGKGMFAVKLGDK